MIGHAKVHASRGFTLIELIVIFTIIALLAALLIPAVQSARESARRLSCMSNLRQFGLALNSYVASVGCFPFSVNGRNRYSAHAMLLPYIDQYNLYNAINYSFGYSDPRNRTAFGTNLSLFICPSDGEQSSTGMTNYAGNRGFGFQAFGDNGVFVNASSPCVTYSSISDGSSNTACMSEWLVGVGAVYSKPAGQSVEADQRRYVYNTDLMILPSQVYAFVQTCQMLNTTQAELAALKLGAAWIEGDLSSTMYNHMTGINSNSCANGSFVQQGAFAVASNHATGVNMLAADGHAKFVQASISLTIWQSMGTRAGGEIINQSDSY